MNWKPKGDFIGVPPRKGENMGQYIPAEEFTQEDLDNLIARARNRKLNEYQFLINAGLIPDNPQVEIFEESKLAASVIVSTSEKPKKERAKKEKKAEEKPAEESSENSDNEEVEETKE